MVAEFLKKETPLFDVRSPMEYAQGHIPGAINLPLFTDEERALVGTCYKKEGQKTAIQLGVKLVGPKLHDFLEKVQKESPPFRIYCFRGGMRSGFITWFLNFSGYPSEQLQGGYKAYRRHVLQLFEKPLELHVLGGFTGSGKTAYLQELHQKGDQIIDLEALAEHRGSAFGLVFQQKQPTTEQFENRLAHVLLHSDHSKPIWVEDESRLIGSCSIPKPFFERMLQSQLFFRQKPLEARIEHIISLYGSYPDTYLIECTEKLRKRLGNEKTALITRAIQEKRLHDACRHLLEYYDARYTHALSKHKGPVIHI